MQQKSIVAILVVLIVILAGTTTYFALSKNAYAPSASQTVPAESLAGKIPGTMNQTTTNNQTAATNETANWKTYTNAKYNFSLKYPAEFGISGSERSKSLMETEITEGAVGHTLFDLTIAKNTKAESICNGISVSVQKLENRNFLFSDIQEQISKQNTTIDGQKAIKQIYKNLACSDEKVNQTTEATNESFEVEKNGYVYSISFMGADTSYMNILDNIVSTFKFLK